MSYLDERRAFIEAGRPLKEKKKHVIAKKSVKRIEKEEQEKNELMGTDTLKEKWFKNRRKDMVGTCQCGCGEASQKKDDMYFRHSAAHIFPKKDFPTTMYHPLNWVERRFWGGCHTNMDEGGLDKWVNMADWDDIKTKFHILAPLLSPHERALKFYTKLEQLVNAN